MDDMTEAVEEPFACCHARITVARGIGPIGTRRTPRTEQPGSALPCSAPGFGRDRRAAPALTADLQIVYCSGGRRPRGEIPQGLIVRM